MVNWGRKTSPAQQLESAQEQLKGAKQHQKDLSELRGMPGYKEALKSSADNINKAQKAVKAAQKAVQNER
ncbi:hypothetical protein [Kribbella soli]|uniref:Uncharacterized protein n=1 Tax=Kribbella soli TaxID=1124743 RepID=A0A4R0HIW5_9ACTN|nr:hypothetical protein [Kribbella soli]TCC11307.1 hypothetical protein E0H45_08515 [Kribbella soli]